MRRRIQLLLHLLDWKFYLEGLELSQISYNMETPTLPLLSARLERGMISKGEVDIGKQEIDVQTVAVAEGECRIQTAASKPFRRLYEELTDTIPVDSESRSGRGEKLCFYLLESP